MADLAKFMELIKNASNEELAEFERIISQRRVRSLNTGDRVQFTGRHGVTVKGTIRQINIKTINVKADNGVSWRVSPNLLTKI